MPVTAADFGLGFPQRGGVGDISPITQALTGLIKQKREDDLLKQQQQAQTLQKAFQTTALNLIDISKKGNVTEKRKAIFDLSKRVSATGQDTSLFNDLLKITNNDELDTAILQIARRAGDADKQLAEVLKPVEKFEEVLGPGGEVVAQRNIATNRVFSDPRAVAAGTGLTNVKEAAGGGFIGIDENNQSVFIPPPQNKLTSAQAKALEISPEQEADVFKREQGLRKEFTALSKDFIKVRDAHTRVLESSKDPSAAGDLALIFNYMKVLDPGSVVRESEFATAEGAQAAIGDIEAEGGIVPNFVKRAVQKAVVGTRLLPEQRNDFVDRSTRLFKGQLKNQKELERRFTGVSKRSEANPENVVLQFRLSGSTIPIEELTAEDLQSMTDEELQALIQ